MTGIVDCDVHPAPVSSQVLDDFLPLGWRDRRQLAQYLPQQWQRYREALGDRSYMGAEYPRPTPRAARGDSWPGNGGPPGSDLGLLREQLLDAWQIDYGVMNPLLGAGEQLNLEYGGALCHAINDWQREVWTSPEPRLHASVCVPFEDAGLSAAEIRRVAADEAFCQVLVHCRTQEPLGRRKYWPIYEAAVEYRLPVAIHFGGWGGHPPTPAGFPSFYIEDTFSMAAAFAAQLTSLVFEGVLERFPGLRFVLIESGLTWLPGYFARLDRSWRLLHDEVAHVSRTPSEQVRAQVAVTTQPFDEPGPPSRLADFFAKLSMDDRVLFSTDYPHWDFESPGHGPLRLLDPVRKQRIMRDNAMEWFRFGNRAHG
jgi:predicted TIM-barrel fold metal-dependent hydrolase